MANSYGLRTHCSHGHEFTPENTLQRKDGGRVCRTCKNGLAKKRHAANRDHYLAKKREYRQNNLDKIRDADKLYRKTAYDKLSKEERHSVYAEQLAREINLSKKDPLMYLKLDPDQAKLSDEVNFQVERVDEVDRSRPKCEGNPGPYMDYPEDRPPTVVEAMKLCYGCRILEQCAAYGASLNEGDNQADGVWGGEVWKDGEKLYG